MFTKAEMQVNRFGHCWAPVSGDSMQCERCGVTVTGMEKASGKTLSACPATYDSLPEAVEALRRAQAICEGNGNDDLSMEISKARDLVQKEIARRAERVQSVEIEVNGPRDPSRVAKLVKEELEKIRANPTRSPLVQRWNYADERFSEAKAHLDAHDLKIAANMLACAEVLSVESPAGERFAKSEERLAGNPELVLGRISNLEMQPGTVQPPAELTPDWFAKYNGERG